MTGIAAWLPLIAILISAASLAVAVTTFKRAGPRVKARAAARVNSEVKSMKGQNDVDIAITSTNQGLAAVEIVGVGLTFKSRLPFINRILRGFVINFTQDELSSGSDLPYRLEPGTQRTWKFNLSKLVFRFADELGELATCRHMPRPKKTGLDKRLDLAAQWMLPVPVFVVDLGNGFQVLSNRIATGGELFRQVAKMMLELAYESGQETDRANEAD